MGCKSSSEKEELPQDSREFARLAETHVVAQKVRVLWDDFEDASALAQGKVETDVWATDGPELAVSHQSVADVGRTFYGYLRERVQRLNWEAEYHYDVNGSATTGTIEVKAQCTIGTGKHIFHHRIHYHACV